MFSISSSNCCWVRRAVPYEEGKYGQPGHVLSFSFSLFRLLSIPPPSYGRAGPAGAGSLEPGRSLRGLACERLAGCLYLEGEMLEEVGGAVGLVGLGAGAGINPHADRGGLGIGRVLGSDLEEQRG